MLIEKKLYGLKQSLRQWYKEFNKYVLSRGFTRIEFDTCLYFSLTIITMFILFHVDDMLLINKSTSKLTELKR